MPRSSLWGGSAFRRLSPRLGGGPPWLFDSSDSRCGIDAKLYAISEGNPPARPPRAHEMHELCCLGAIQSHLAPCFVMDLGWIAHEDLIGQ